MLYAGSTLVKGSGFDSRRRVGSAIQAVKVYNMREVDEAVFLDIEATREGRGPNFELIGRLGDECFAPFSVGGGVRSVDDARQLLRVGADKVVINTVAVDRPEIIRGIAESLGSQSLVVSIDVRREIVGHRVYVDSGTRPTRWSPAPWAERAVARGAGEILITSIDRDGTMDGYDIELIRLVSEAVPVPVIASGGVGEYQHFADGMDAGASAVAAASIFHFTDATPLGAKKYLKERGYPMRVEEAA